MTVDFDGVARGLLPLLGGPPSLGLVLGSGLGGFASTLGDTRRVPYADIPGFPAKSASRDARAGPCVHATARGTGKTALQSSLASTAMP